MEEEIYETRIGTFRAIIDIVDSNFVHVHIFIPTHEGGDWEPVGYMKKKDFFKLIHEHKPKRLTPYTP
ncbi:MAG: hypothetical protein ACTSRS_17650 [Candidatus Helarchaeota archaeon]